jgi:hypothetical protein
VALIAGTDTTAADDKSFGKIIFKYHVFPGWRRMLDGG